MPTITLTPEKCSSPAGWTVLYNYLTTNSSFYPRQILFTFPNSAVLGGAGVHFTGIAVRGRVRNGASAVKRLRMGFRTSEGSGVSEWAMLDGGAVLDDAFEAIGPNDGGGFIENRFERKYATDKRFGAWIQSQFAAGNPLYFGVIQPDGGKSVSVDTTLSEWAIEIAYELLGNIPAVNRTNVQPGETIAVTVNRIIEGSETVLRYKIGGTVLESVSLGTAATHTFQIPESIGAYFPNTTNENLIIEAATHCDGAEYATVSTSVSVNIPENAFARIQYSVERIWAGDNGINAYVQRQSGVRVTVSAEGQYGANIVSIALETENSRYVQAGDSAVFTHLPFAASGTIPLTIAATDSRGKVATETFSVEALAWEAPSIQAFAISRASEKGAICISGTCARAEAQASVSGLIANVNVSQSGNPIAFKDMEAGETLQVCAEWTPHQEGSGEPSCANIRAIMGLESVCVTRQDGKSFSAALPETVYGGTLDESGKVQKTWAFQTLDGTESWYAGSSGFWAYPNGYDIVTDKANAKYEIICDRFKSASFQEYRESSGTVTHDSSFCFHTEFESVAAWKEYLAEQYAQGTPVQVAYKRKAPIAFAVSPLTIETLKGENTFAGNADTVTAFGTVPRECNALTFRIQYRPIGAEEGEWAETDSVSAENISASISGLLTKDGEVLNAFDDMSGYAFRLLACDRFAASSANDQMPTKEQFLDVDEKSGNMGFGGDAPASGEPAGFRFYRPVDFAEGYKVYSETETDTGNRWLDGKKIYRACISAQTDLVNAQGAIAALPSAVETPVSLRAFVKAADANNWRMAPNTYYGNEAWTVGVYVIDDTVYMSFGSAWAGKKQVVVIAEYTKGA